MKLVEYENAFYVCGVLLHPSLHPLKNKTKTNKGNLNSIRNRTFKLAHVLAQIEFVVTVNF